MKKKKIVEEDKKKITLVIKELDEKKKQALRTAWDQVLVVFIEIVVGIVIVVAVLLSLRRTACNWVDIINEFVTLL